LGSIRVRILAVVVVMLVVSSIGSVLLLRAVLFERLDDEVDESLTREAEEFGLLIAGNNPETGEPFDGDLRAVFDVYFAREVPDEGESLLAFVGGSVYRSERAQDAAEAGQLQPADRLLARARRARAGRHRHRARERQVHRPAVEGAGRGRPVRRRQLPRLRAARDRCCGTNPDRGAADHDGARLGAHRCCSPGACCGRLRHWRAPHRRSPTPT